MKKLIALLLALCMVFALAACGSSPAPSVAPAEENNSEAEPPETSSEPIEIVYWHTLTDHHQENLQKVIDKFNASQDKYVVVQQAQPYSEFDAKLLQSTSTGTGPDIANMFASTAISYMTDGYLHSYSEFINDPEIGIPNFKSEISEGFYNEITQWGNEDIYLFPILFGSEVLYYNKTWFDELGLEEPTTWAEVEECAKAITEAYGVPGFGTDSITDTFQGWMIQSGGNYIDVDSKSIAIDKDMAVEWMNWFKTGVDEGYFRLVGEDYYFSNPFGSEAVGMYVGSSAGVNYALGAIPAEGEAGHFEMGCCALPQGDVNYISSWGTTIVCLSQDEEHARGAYEFLKFWTEPEQLIDWAIAFGSAPAWRTSMESERYQEHATTNVAAKALIQEFDYANYLPSILGADTVRTEIDKMVNSVALGITDAETAFDNFVAAANAALNDY